MRIQVSFLLTVGLLLIPDFSWAGDDCGFAIYTNDLEATIEVDGSEINPKKAFVPCNSEEQQLIVTSIDGQVFERKLPAIERGSKERKHINIIFGPLRIKDIRVPAQYLETSQTNPKRVELESISRLRLKRKIRSVIDFKRESERIW